MIFKFDVRKRLNSTRLRILQKSDWVVGSSSILMERAVQLIDAGMTTGASVYSARTAAIDTAHALEDYACSDYKCLTLDCIAAGCDLGATAVAFLPKNNVTTSTFATFTCISKFSRTLRNRCKDLEGGLFGCKK